MPSVRSSWQLKLASANKRSRGGCRRRVVFLSCGEAPEARLVNRGEDSDSGEGEHPHGCRADRFSRARRVLQAEYEQWRLALGEEGRASLTTVKRIRTLERELARKEKALAEATALLQALELEDEGDGTDEEHEP